MRVGIVGVGAIGGYLAAALRRQAELYLVDRSRNAPSPPPEAAPLEVSADYGRLAPVEICLVCVKAMHTADVARALRPVLSPEATVVSLQNGLRAPAMLREVLGARVAAGVVGFNVRVEPDGRRRRATAGKLYIERLAPPHEEPLSALARSLRASGERVELVRDIEPVAIGKLLMNLNNGVCAATGLSIAESLESADARWIYARCIREALCVLARAGKHAARLTPVPPSLLATALMLPDSILRPALRATGQVGASARSSTLADLEAGRMTEIDELNGAIARLAREHEIRAPVNELLTRIVHQHEQRARSGAKPDYLSAAALRALVTRELSSP